MLTPFSILFLVLVCGPVFGTSLENSALASPINGHYLIIKLNPSEETLLQQSGTSDASNIILDCNNVHETNSLRFIDLNAENPMVSHPLSWDEGDSGLEFYSEYDQEEHEPIFHYGNGNALRNVKMDGKFYLQSNADKTNSSSTTNTTDHSTNAHGETNRPQKKSFPSRLVEFIGNLIIYIYQQFASGKVVPATPPAAPTTNPATTSPPSATPSQI